MLVTMKREVFDNLDHEELGKACIGPTLALVMGKDITTKAQVYSALTSGQQALFMFHVMHGHIHSAAELYGFSYYFITELKALTAIKLGLLRFEDEAMHQLYTDLEAIMITKNRLQNGSWREATVMDLDHDHQLLDAFTELYNRYQELAPQSLQRISFYIQNHPQEFVQIDN
ncbi:hypothetical protein D3C73_539730 [compost metagenome]